MMRSLKSTIWTAVATAFAIGAHGFSTDVYKSVALCSYISADLQIRTQEQPCIVEHPERSQPLMYVTFRSGAKITVKAEDNGNGNDVKFVGVTINDKPATYLPSEKGYAFSTDEGEIFTIAPIEANGSFDETVKKYPELWDSLEPSESRVSSSTNTAQGEVYHAATGSSFALMQKVETNTGPQNHIFYRNIDGYGGIERVVDLDHDGIDELIVSTLPGCNICEVFTTWIVFARDEEGLFQEKISDIQFEPEIKFDENNIAYFEGRSIELPSGRVYPDLNSAHTVYEKYIYESGENAGRIELRPEEYLKTSAELELHALFDRADSEEDFVLVGLQRLEYEFQSTEYVLECDVQHWSVIYNLRECKLNGIQLDPDLDNQNWSCARIGFVEPVSDSEELRLVCDGNKTATVSELLNGAG